ncbi:TPA: hypothetical protein ACH3X1_010848 [Trebouxia sp. C0004]
MVSRVSNQWRLIFACGRTTSSRRFRRKRKLCHNNMYAATYGSTMEGLAFDEHAWAVEHFLLNDPKVQQQLFKYWILPAKDLEKEGMPSSANQDQRQSWILQKAAADYTAFIPSTDITVDHLQCEAAGIIFEQYAKQLGHSLQQWTDSTVALANIKEVLDGLGRASVAWQSQEAAIAHAVAVNANSEPHADAAALDTDSIANLGSELLQV